MAIRLPIETEAGTFSEAITYSRLIEHLKLAAEDAYLLGHNMKANDDLLRGQGFLAIGQMLEIVCTNVTDLATKGLRQ
jgi:hypothetical protein